MTSPTIDTPAARLKLARQEAGHESAASAARLHGWEAGAYRHHENGTRNIPPKSAEKYARAYGVTAGWLLGLAEADRRTYAEELQRGLYTDAEAASVRDFDKATAESYGIAILSSSPLSGLSGDNPALLGDETFAIDISVLEQVAPGRSVTPLTFMALRVDLRVDARAIDPGAVLIVDRAAPRIRRQGAMMLYTYAGFVGVTTMFRHPDETVELMRVGGDESSIRVALRDVLIWGQVLWIGQPPQ